MPDFPRDLPHLYLGKNGKPEPYISKNPPPQYPIPQRDRGGHAQAIRSALDTAFALAEVRRREREPDLALGTPGSYFDFQIQPSSEIAIDLLENRKKSIELVTVHQDSPTGPMVATVLLPDRLPSNFLKKGRGLSIREYREGQAKERGSHRPY